MEEFLSKCLEFLASAEGSAATIAVVLDFALRMMPSKKPLGVVHMVAKMIGMVGKVLVKVSEISDKVLPQKVKEE
jgi:hypothetical protein